MNKLLGPELLQRERVGVIGSVPIYVEPIADSTEVSETINPLVHLRVVSEFGDFFTLDDLNNMALNWHQVDKLYELCARRSQVLLGKYLPSHKPGTEAHLTLVVCGVNDDGKVIVTMHLCGSHQLFHES